MEKDRRIERNCTFVCDLATLEILECLFCDFNTTLKVDLTEHLRVSHEEKEANEELENILKWYHCKSCDLVTYSKLVLLKHLSDCDNNNQPSTSNKRSLSVIEKWNEVKCAEGNKKFYCKYCMYQTPFKKCVQAHILRRHTAARDIKWFQCEQCAFKAKEKGVLKTHILRKHTDTDDTVWFKCPQCVYKSKFKGNLKKHIVGKHLNPVEVNLLKCAQCAYECKNKSSLKRHVQGQHTNPEDCKQCGYKSKNKADLKEHKGQHKGAFSLKCVQCTFKCKIQTTLRAHMISKHANSEDSSGFDVHTVGIKLKRNRVWKDTS